MSSFGVEKLIRNKIDELYVKGKMAKDDQALLPGAHDYVSLDGKRGFASAVKIMDVDNPGGPFEAENSG